MKRLLQISLDTLLVSILYIFLWIILGFVFGKEITYVFTLTGPIQFLYLIFNSLFATGPNITAQKYNDKNIVNSNMLLGVILVGVITLIIVLNIDKYIVMMNMEINTYYIFTIYSIILMYLNFIIQLVTTKLYYENHNSISNKINLIFNLSNFLLILLISLITKNQFYSISLTLIIDFILAILIFIKYFKIAKLVFKIKDNIKYSSFDLIRNIGMLITYGIGYKTVFSYGSSFIAAISLDAITTDAQWDILTSIDIAAKIDLAKNEFNYKESKKNAFKLIGILICSSLIMNVILYNYYKPNLIVLLILLLIEFVDMLVIPFKNFKICYLQVNKSDVKHNLFYMISRILRLLCSFIQSVFCTYIGQVVTMIYMLIYSNIACSKAKIFK